MLRAYVSEAKFLTASRHPIPKLNALMNKIRQYVLNAPAGNWADSFVRMAGSIGPKGVADAAAADILATATAISGESKPPPEVSLDGGTTDPSPLLEAAATACCSAIRVRRAACCSIKAA